LRSSSLRCWPPKLICLRPEPGAWLRNMAAIKGLYNLEHLGVNATLHPQFKDAACNLSLFSRSLPILFFLASSLSREQITCQFYIFFLFFPPSPTMLPGNWPKKRKTKRKTKTVFVQGEEGKAGDDAPPVPVCVADDGDAERDE
jgi:hypothetical protein